MKYLITILFLCLAFVSKGQSKDTTKKKSVFQYEVIDGDTIPIYTLKEFEYKDPEFEKKWHRTVWFVRRVYPYAEIVDSIVKDHDAQLNEIEKKRKRKKKTKQLRQNLLDDYRTEISQMSVTRGEYLAKIVHKKTGYTIYDLIKKYKNSSTAFMWQTVVKMYGGANLKTTYDPTGEDWMLKLVLDKIEKGEIKTIPRSVQKKRLLAKLKKEKEEKKKKK